MNQGKLEVVKQEMVRVNTDIFRIIKLKWTGMGEFNSDNHFIYYCGQESLRRNGVAIIVNKRVQSVGNKEVFTLEAKQGSALEMRWIVSDANLRNPDSSPLEQQEPVPVRNIGLYLHFPFLCFRSPFLLLILLSATCMDAKG